MAAVQFAQPVTISSVMTQSIYCLQPHDRMSRCINQWSGVEWDMIILSRHIQEFKKFVMCPIYKCMKNSYFELILS